VYFLKKNPCSFFGWRKCGGKTIFPDLLLFTVINLVLVKNQNPEISMGTLRH